MEKIAKFMKVSFAQFEADWKKQFPACDNVREIYDNIKLPKRATAGSAGYDFYTPADVTLTQGKSTLIPTGIRAQIADGWVLSLYPRSGLGFKHRVQLDNTVGIIDADYFGADNEGHIMIKVSCDAHEAGHTVALGAGDGFAQGIFLPFGITEDDEASEKRTGGFGSTSK